MTQAPELPLQMRRNGFDPVEELARARDDEGVVRVETPFGLSAYLVCRHEDVRPRRQAEGWHRRNIRRDLVRGVEMATNEHGVLNKQGRRGPKSPEPSTEPETQGNPAVRKGRNPLCRSRQAAGRER